MSFVIHFWETPLPRSVAEAESILGQLVRRTDRVPQPALDSLVKALLDRYPRDIDSDDEDPVWTDTLSGPREALPYESIGIATAHVDEVIPFTVKTANGLGLVVYEPQSGIVFLPDGTVLGGRPAPARPVPAAAQDRATEVAVARQLLELLKPYMATRGFAWRKLKAGDTRFVSTFQGGAHLLEPVVMGVAGGVRVNFLVESHLDVLDRVINGLLSPGSSRHRETLRGSLASYLTAVQPKEAERLLRYYQEALLVTRMSEVLPLAETLVGLFEGGLMALLFEVESPAGYWELAKAELRGMRQPALRESVLCKLVSGRLCDDRVWIELASVEKTHTHAQIQSLRAHPKGPGDKFELGRLEGHLRDVTRLAEYLGQEFQPDAA